jgi:hypothetical protein
MFLAQFHAGACPPPEGSCFNSANNAVFKTQMETYNSSIQEVISNLKKVETCISSDPTRIDVTFVNEAPAVTNCVFPATQVECLAEDIYEFVTKRYVKWDWLVIAYHYVNADDGGGGGGGGYLTWSILRAILYS